MLLMLAIRAFKEELFELLEGVTLVICKTIAVHPKYDEYNIDYNCYIWGRWKIPC
jgi:hypothetical protein